MSDHLDALDRAVDAARADTRRGVHPQPPEFDSVRARARRRRSAVLGSGAVAVLAVVVVSVGLFDRGDAGGDHRVVTGPPPTTADQDDPTVTEPLPWEPGEARVMSDSPLAGRHGASTVWTGREFLIWGGLGDDGPLADGAAYDPETDVWEMLPAAPLGARHGAVAAWTGSELVVVGGITLGQALADGAAYDPVARTWRAIAPPPGGMFGQSVVIDRTLYAVLEGGDLLAYDVGADTWLVIEPPTPIRALIGARGPGEVIAEAGSGVLLAYDAAAGGWSELPVLERAAWSIAAVGESIVAVDVLDLVNGIRVLGPGDAAWLEVEGLPGQPELGSELGVDGPGWPPPGLGAPLVVGVDSAVTVYAGGDVAWALHLDERRWTPTDAGGIANRGFAFGAVGVADDRLMVWSGWGSVLDTNPMGEGDMPMHRDGVVMRLPEPWPSGRPYHEFTTSRSDERLAAAAPLDLGPGLDGWSVDGPTFAPEPFAYADERILSLATSVDGAVEGVGPVAVLRLVDVRLQAWQPVHHEVAGFEVSVFVNPDRPTEVVAMAKGELHTVRWTSVGLDEAEAVDELSEWLRALAADWEEPGCCPAGLQAVSSEDGRISRQRSLVPRWTITAPDGTTYQVRRRETPDDEHLARVAIWARIAGGRTVARPTGEGPSIWEFGGTPETDPPSVAWFGDGVRWVVEGLTLEDPNLAVFLDNLLG